MLMLAVPTEPDSLANMVTNLSVAKCSEAQSAYYECVNYALINLNLANVAMYIDAGHAGWLGWPANLTPAAELFAQVYKNASAPASLRGLATNVANYNAWTISSPPSYTSGDANYDEELYVNALSPLLEQNGWSGAYFITDTCTLLSFQYIHINPDLIHGNANYILAFSSKRCSAHTTAGMG